MVYWYVKAPGEANYGTVVKVVEGGEDAKTSTMEHTFSDIEENGSYIVTAYIYGSDHNIYEYCYSIWVTKK